jgi:predicted nucleic acid-binding protein
MSGRRYLFDSMVLIDHLNGHEPATAFMLANADHSAVSTITRAEVMSGIEDQEHTVVAALLDRFDLIVVDRDIADLAARLRRSHRWKLPDALQAACALTTDRLLATRDEKAFSPRRHKFVKIPYRL